jgi:hypothetical protein
MSETSDILAHPSGLSGPQLTRHIQLNRTQEMNTIVTIETTNRMLSSALVTTSSVVRDYILAATSIKDKELIRLRRELVAERKHRKRLAASVISRLRSKANECRILRDAVNDLDEARTEHVWP